MRKIALHIEELVLHGFAAGSRHTIGDAVRAEIERRLGEGGVPEAWARDGAIDRIAACEVRVPALPRSAGSAIGAAVHRALTSNSVLPIAGTSSFQGASFARETGIQELGQETAMAWPVFMGSGPGPNGPSRNDAWGFRPVGPGSRR